MAAESSPEECLDYVNSYLLDKDYANAMAWVDYGLRNYPGNLKLEIARFKVAINDMDKKNDAPARDRLKSLLSGRSNELNDAIYDALIDSGYYRPNMRLVLPTNSKGIDYFPTAVPLDVIAVGMNRIIPKMPEEADVKVALPVMWQPVIWVRNVSDYTIKSARISIELGQTSQLAADREPLPATPAQPGREGRENAAGPGDTKASRPPMDMPADVPEADNPEQPSSRSSSQASGEFTIRPGDMKRVALITPLTFQGERLAQPLQCIISWINREEDRTSPLLIADKIDPDDVPVFNLNALEKP